MAEQDIREQINHIIVEVAKYANRVQVDWGLMNEKV